MKSFLAFNNVSLKYGKTRVLHMVNLELEKSELVTLVGPSGCGKSTLLRIVSGLLTPQEGQVVLDGRDITTLPPEKRQMGWVPQSYALFEHLNVFNNVAFGLRHHKLSKANLTRRVQEMLELCQIETLTQRPVSALSGGQKQRVAVARALAIKPRVLLLDEPLAALDPQLRGELRGGLKTLIQESGVTTLFVTHDQTEALSLADRVAVMRAGSIEQFARPEQVWSRPANEFVAQFFGSATVLQSKRLDAKRLELLPGLIVMVSGTHAPQIALRRQDLECASEGSFVKVLHSEYTGDTYTVKAQHANGAVIHFISPKPLTPEQTVCVNVHLNYTPTLLGEIND